MKPSEQELLEKIDKILDRIEADTYYADSSVLRSAAEMLIESEAKCKELEAEIARLETEPCSALRWQQGEPTSNGFWWLRAGNLSPRVVRAYHNGSVMVHDYTGPVAVPYGNFECAGPLPEPAPNGRGEARESASVASTELLAQSKEKKP